MGKRIAVGLVVGFIAIIGMAFTGLADPQPTGNNPTGVIEAGPPGVDPNNDPVINSIEEARRPVAYAMQPQVNAGVLPGVPPAVSPDADSQVQGVDSEPEPIPVEPEPPEPVMETEESVDEDGERDGGPITVDPRDTEALAEAIRTQGAIYIEENFDGIRGALAHGIFGARVEPCYVPLIQDGADGPVTIFVNDDEDLVIEYPRDGIVGNQDVTITISPGGGSNSDVTVIVVEEGPDGPIGTRHDYDDINIIELRDEMENLGLVDPHPEE